ncbi:MAG: 4Fe-4S dicluster domain-containing protein [bacterium]|nr:4Fe-4S dicluster domain-containing protein [bacterium]
MNRKRLAKSLLKLIVLHLMVLAAFVLSPTVGQFLIPALSPHITIVGSIAACAVGVSTLVALPMLVIVTLRRRWFCRMLCPVGLIVDSCAKARPHAKYAYRKVPPIGQWLLLASLGGAIAGWPLFLWLDPLSIFTASLNALSWPMDAVAVCSLSAMGAIVVMSLIFPKFWCLKLCPLGGAQEMLFGLKLLVRRKKEARPKSLSGVALARRSAIFTGLGVAGGLAVAAADSRRNQPQLRPPGAVDDTKFKGLCARCGNCVKACPREIIRQDLRLSDPAGLLTPIVHFEKGDQENYRKHCCRRCNACTQVCPTGAIAPLSLPEKLCHPIGLAAVDMTGCLLTDGINCGACLHDLCPRDAITKRGMFSKILIDPARCNGCGACVLTCPVKVIEVRPNGRYTIEPYQDSETLG